MRLSSLFIVIGLFTSSSFAYAGDRCNNATTQAELTECSAQAYQTADEALNEAYQMLVDQLSNNTRHWKSLEPPSGLGSVFAIPSVHLKVALLKAAVHSLWCVTAVLKG